MSKRLATLVAAMTVALMVTAIAWAAEGPESIRSEGSNNPGSTTSTGVVPTSSSRATSSTGVTSPIGSTSSTGSTSTIATAAIIGSRILVLADGQVGDVAVGEAGRILVRRSGGALTIVSTQANPGWLVEVEVAAGREVEGDFRNGSRRLRFNFELEDGVIRVRIESEGSTSSSVATTSNLAASTTGSTSTTGVINPTESTVTTSTTPRAAALFLPTGSVAYDLDGAGQVTVVFNGGQMAIGSINPAAGWVIDESEQESDEIRVELTNGDAEAELRVRISDGQLRVDVDRKN